MKTLVYQCWSNNKTVTILLSSLLPESPRWLLVTGQTKKADDIVKNMAEVNRVELPEDFTLADFHVVCNCDF